MSSCESFHPSEVSHLIVVGGQQRSDAVGRDEWQAYQAARIVLVELRTGLVSPLLRYSGNPACLPDQEPSVLFKSATMTRTHLFACTTTELAIIDLKQWQIERLVTHPWLNDVHHVVPTAAGSMLVVNTGLDQVLELDRDGKLLREWNTASTPTWDRFDQSVDYRKVLTTKPHESHPNFLFHRDGEWWVTRFHHRDACCLTKPGRTLDLRAKGATEASSEVSDAGPHDGVWDGAAHWFTTVDGQLLHWPVDQPLPRTISLSRSGEADALLGWCRGVAPIGGDSVWVGFSRLRPTKFRSHVSWIKHGFRKVGQHATAPTRIAEHRLSNGVMLREIDLEPAGIAAVFSIFPWSDSCCGESFPMSPSSLLPSPE